MAIIKKVDSGVKLSRIKGFSHDYIQCDNGLSKSELCTQKEFDTGKVVIMRDGKKVDKI